MVFVTVLLTVTAKVTVLPLGVSSTASTVPCM
jgi:hypothetical protein